jgi:hypothetical protein
MWRCAGLKGEGWADRWVAGALWLGGGRLLAGTDDAVVCSRQWRSE